ncbi:MAG: hypothetical protein ACP5R5_08615, partial [Armatimonadota bacterium]
MRLEGLSPKQQESQAEPSRETDEVALGEELFEVWQIYSRGELDNALGRVQKILQKTPESASAHSILALIFERKAERAAEAGSEEEARDFLKLAIAEYERIIDLNPDSAADREKLASLRMRIAGLDVVSRRAQRARFRALVGAVPTPVWAAFGTFLIVLVTAIILIPGGQPEKVTPARPGRAAKVANVSTPRPRAQSTAPSESRVYVFSGQDRTTYSPTPPVVGAVPQTRPTASPITQPARLPPIHSSNVNVKVAPESKSATANAEKQAAPASKPPEPEEKPSNRPEGDSVLARAIQLGKQGAT